MSLSNLIKKNYKYIFFFYDFYVKFYQVHDIIDFFYQCHGVGGFNTYPSIPHRYVSDCWFVQKWVEFQPGAMESLTVARGDIYVI